MMWVFYWLAAHTHAIGVKSYGKPIVLEISVLELDLTPSPPTKKEKRGQEI